MTPHKDPKDMLIMKLGEPSVNEALEHRHGEFLQGLHTRFGSTVVTDLEGAIKHLIRYAPIFIIAVDGSFALSQFRAIHNLVATAVRNGSVLIMCCDFASGVHHWSFKNMILNSFNLGWEFGKLHKAEYTLNGACDALLSIEKAAELEVHVKMMAVQIYDVNDESRLYVDVQREGKTPEKNQTPIALKKLDKGHVVYIGDVYNLPSSQFIILEFIKGIFDKKHAPKNIHPPKSKGRVNLWSGLLRSGSATPEPAKRKVLSPSASESEAILSPPKITPKIAPFKPEPASLFAGRQMSRNGRNTAPLNQRAPCLNCGKASTNRACSMCKAVFFCSGACESIAWKSHKETCSANRISLAQAIALAENGNPTPLVKELIHIHEPRIAIERLIDAYRIRIEDLRKISHIKAGHYKQPPGHAPPQPPYMEDFITFLRHMQGTTQIVRPHWWDLNAQNQCEDLARNHVLRTYVGKKANDDEIVTHYDGQMLMPKALRILGDVLYGGKVPEPQEEEAEDEGGFGFSVKPAWDEASLALMKTGIMRLG
ncbi:hypothetical protein ABW21_db0206072 [Orbilia brochopaga]|nr:hypothetical protein ABW21_db0206072 [Drechslerella brochopaga]